jgi:hypothetical protein
MPNIFTISFYLEGSPILLVKSAFLAGQKTQSLMISRCANTKNLEEPR